MNLPSDPYDRDYLDNEKMLLYMKEVRDKVLELLSPLEIAALDEDIDDFKIAYERLVEKEYLETLFD
jgi:hypothetical protein